MKADGVMKALGMRSRLPCWAAIVMMKLLYDVGKLFGGVLMDVLASVLICDRVFFVFRACSRTLNDAKVRWYIRFIASIRDALLFVKDE